MSSKVTHPRILIFGQPFNTYSGGGITLTNLFSGWPEDRIAVISYNFMLAGATRDICDKYYQLGQEEIHWLFPFSFAKPKHKSGLIDIPDVLISSVQKTENRQGFRLSAFFLNLFLRWTGADHFISGISVSECLKSWLSEYKPELLYFQISNRESINFARSLVEHLRIPAVIHMMDDWPSVIADGSVFRKFWKRKIGRELQILMDMMDLHLSICDEMSVEYEKRYGHKFYPFHNTIDLERWIPYTRKDLSVNKGTKNILFSGRVGKGIEKSLLELTVAVDRLRTEGIDIMLQIRSPRCASGIMDQIVKHKSVKVKPPVEYSRMPELYSEADVLVIANDFSIEGISFLKYSMPTKAPEYLISGSPVLVYASSETALYKLFHDNECGHCVASQDSYELANAIKLLMQDFNYRDMLSRNAVAYAMQHFNSKEVRYRFQTMLKDLAGRP